MSNHFLDKPLPSSEESELRILGSILMDDRLLEVAIDKLVTEDFYHPFYRRVFDGMVKCREYNYPIDPIRIVEVWKSEGIDAANMGGGVAAVTNLTFGIPPMDKRGVADLCNVIKEHSVRRQMVLRCSRVVSDILEGREDINEIVDTTESFVTSLSTKLHSEKAQGTEKPFTNLIEIVPDIRRQLQDYHLGITNGVSTGMKEVDDMLDGGGLQPGGLYVVAAGEKAGKTSLALDWLYHISAVQGYRTLVITGEMNKITMAKRIYSAHAGIPYFKFRPGIYDSADDPVYSNALQGLDKFGRIPMAISDKLTKIGPIRRYLTREVEKGKKSGDPKDEVKAALIDYIQLVGAGVSNRTQEVETVSREIKLLTMELGIPIIAISSTNRLKLDGQQVLDSDNLRQAGSIAFDAEALFFIHNPAYVPGQPYTPMPVTPMNLILSRQRNGPTGTIPVMFIGPYMQFMTVADYERRRGARNTDNTIPKSIGQEQQEEEDAMSLWNQ